MRFYFIILLTSSPFMASCDRINGSKLTTTPHVSSMNPADANLTTVAVERMRLAVNGTADKINEERMFPSSSTVEAVHAIESKWRRTPVAFPTRGSPELERAKTLISVLTEQMKHEQYWKSIQSTLYDHSEFWDVDSLLFALGQLKHFPPQGINPNVPATFHHMYLKGLEREGYTPLQLLSKLNQPWVPSRSVLSNLNDYTALYYELDEINEVHRLTLATLMEYVGNDYDLALVMSHLRRQGGELVAKLYHNLVEYFARRYPNPDDLFELLSPKNGESEWNFEMLYHVFNRNLDTLREFLERKFGGIHVLAPILAGADESDITSKNLQRSLAWSLYHLDFEHAVKQLNLERAPLTKNNLDTLRLYTEIKNEQDDMNMDWRQRLAAIRKIDVRTLPVFPAETTHAWR